MTRVSADKHCGDVLTVHVPFKLRQRAGRKVIVPVGVNELSLAPSRPDSTLLKAIARAFRWKRLLESQTYSTIAELASVEKINASYVSRVLRLTLLAPDIVVAILDGNSAPNLNWAKLARPFPLEWSQQRLALM